MTIFQNDFTTPGTVAKVRLELEVTVSSQDYAANTSTLAWTLRMVEYVNGSPFRAYNDCTASASVNGSVFSASTLNYDFNLTNETITVATGTRVVAHDTDGTKTIAVAASYDGKSPLGTASISSTMALPSIPRASTPTYSNSSPNAGTAITITTNRADATYTHDLGYRWQGTTTSYTSIGTGVGASTSWTVPSALLNDMPTVTSRVLEILTTTKTSGGSTVGTTLTTITVGVASTVVPDFGTVTHAEAVTSPNVASLIGAYVQNVSKLTLAITSAVAGTGATVTAKSVEVRSGTTVLQTVDVTAGSAATPAVITASGSLTLRGTVTDSRGRTYYEDVSITVLAYTGPTITTVTLSRSLSDGTISESGTYIRTDLNAAVQSLIVSAVQKNALTYRISTSPKGAGTWTVKSTTTVAGVTFNSHAEVGTYSVSASFDVRVEVYDKLTSASPSVVESTISTGGVFLHLGNTGQGVGVGKYWETGRGSVDALDRMYQRNGVAVVDQTDLTDVTTPLTSRVGVLEAVHGPNLIVNPRFRTNQRGVASGVSMLPAVYSFDQWETSPAEEGTNLLTNLITNPSIEAATTGWTGVPGTTGVVGLTSAAPATTTAFGTKVLKALWSTASTAAGGGAYFQTGASSVTAGTVYSFQFGHVKSSINNRLQMKLEWYNASNVLIGSATLGTAAQVTAGTIYTTFKLENQTAPTAASYVRAYIISATGTGYANWSINSFLELDGLMLNVGATVYSYFDGATADTSALQYDWTGTANASTSTSTWLTVLTGTLNAFHGQTLTISSGRRLITTLERARVPAGSYVLSWSGTASGRVYNSGSAGGAFAASPVLFTADGAADVVVEFEATGAARTVDNVQFQLGATATSFEMKPLPDEQRDCYRYYYRITSSSNASGGFMLGVMTSATSLSGMILLPVEMRATPVLSGTAAASLEVRTGVALTPSAYALSSSSTAQVVLIDVTTGTGTAGQAGIFRAKATGHYIDLTAEL